MARESQPFLGRTALSVHLSWMQHSTPCVVIRDNGFRGLQAIDDNLQDAGGYLKAL
jgi:hypothetical protein